MPRRYQPPASRRKKRASKPNIPVAPVPPELPPEPVQSVAVETRPRPVAARPAAPPPISTGPTIRHITRDYSYVVGEVRLVALFLLVIIGGLIGTAAALRWF